MLIAELAYENAASGRKAEAGKLLDELRRRSAREYTILEHLRVFLRPLASQVTPQNIWRVLVILNYNTARFLH